MKALEDAGGANRTKVGLKPSRTAREDDVDRRANRTKVGLKHFRRGDPPRRNERANRTKVGLKRD